jgi:hypothetical protein
MGGTNIESRFLGNNSLRVPVLTMGTVSLGGVGQLAVLGKCTEATPLLAATAVQFPPYVIHARRYGETISSPTRPTGRGDVLATTLGVGIGPRHRPPIADATVYATEVAATGLGGVGALPTADSVQGLIDARRSDSTRMVTAR